MENLKHLYEQRLKSLSSTFLYLLDALEDNRLFISQPQLKKYRIQYLGEVIRKTLEDERQKLLSEIYEQMAQIKQKDRTSRKESTTAQKDILTKSLKNNSCSSNFYKQTITVDESNDTLASKPSIYQYYNQNESSKKSIFSRSRNSGCQNSDATYLQVEPIDSSPDVSVQLHKSQLKGRYNHLVSKKDKLSSLLHSNGKYKDLNQKKMVFQNQQSVEDESDANFNFKYLKITTRR